MRDLSKEIKTLQNEIDKKTKNRDNLELHISKLKYDRDALISLYNSISDIVTDKQLKVISFIEHNTKKKFNGLTKSEAQKFISENIEKSKKNCSKCYYRVDKNIYCSFEKTYHDIFEEDYDWWMEEY